MNYLLIGKTILVFGVLAIFASILIGIYLILRHGDEQL